MNYLLDTHTFLWALSAPDKLGNRALPILEDPEKGVFVSAVTAVEISIKRSLGKLRAPRNLAGEVDARGFQHLPFTFTHGEMLASLPAIHQDPFDRMLVAQARSEKLHLISCDKIIAKYAIPVIW